MFDTGINGELLKNLNKVDISPKQINTIILSHGHIDHTGGLRTLDLTNKTIIAHPGSFNQKYFNGDKIGMPIEELDLSKSNIKKIKNPFFISENIAFLGEIPRVNNFEGKDSIGISCDSPDYCLDDSALVINTPKGLIIITGCSHSGVCNIIEYSKKVFHEDRILALIGGFHLIDNKEITDRTINFLKGQSIENIYPMHCIDDYSRKELLKISNERHHLSTHGIKNAIVEENSILHFEFKSLPHQEISLV